MAKYRVLVIAMTIKDNKIAKYNETVDDSQLNSSPVDLVKDGFIELVTEDKKASAPAQTETTADAELTEAKVAYDSAKEAFDALTPETSEEDRGTVTDALKSPIEKLGVLGEDVTELVKIFETVDDGQLNPELDQLKADYLTAVKEKADLPKDAKAKDLATAGTKIADLKAQLVEGGVSFDEDGNIV
jgi:hypothetical protein